LFLLSDLGAAFHRFTLLLVATHACLDEYVANWFGLDQSKYQWALNDYYEATSKVSDSLSLEQECIPLLASVGMAMDLGHFS
jgi:hypothetical protein